MRKKLIRTLLASLVIGSMLSTPAWAESAVVTGNDVNMREGPGTAFRIVDCLPQGECVTVTDRSNPSWYGVEHDGRVGFMSSAFLSITEEETAAPEQTEEMAEQPAEGQPGYVDAMYVRFRSAPGSEFSVLGEYNRGKALMVTGTLGKWTACVIDGRSGYIYSDFVALGTFGGWQEEDVYADAEEEEPEQAETPENSFVPNGEGVAIEIGEEAPETEQPEHTRPPHSEEEAEQAPEETPEEAETSDEQAEEPADDETGSDAPAVTQVAAPGVQQLDAYINADYVRFRTGPATSYQIIDSYDAGKSIGVTGTFENWTACIIDGVFGYVFSEYVTVTGEQPQQQEAEAPQPVDVEAPEAEAPVTMPVPTPVTYVDSTEGYVAGNNVRMRSAPSMSAPIVAELSYGNALTITGISGDWTAVVCNGEEGFIYTQFVKEGSLQQIVSAEQSAGDSLGGSSYEQGVQIAQFALQFVGYNYSWGGKDPSTGFDCSGLVYYTYQYFGITLNRVAQDQARNGVAVSADELQPGDILCFYSGSSYIGHSGIYIGNGMFVHAQNSATGVVVTELTGHYAERGFEARRIV